MRSTRPPDPPPPPPRGLRFGPYTILDRIGVGGMAEVFVAREDGTPEPVVLKRMLPHVAAEPNAAEMLRAEARLGAAVHHPNVVRVRGVGEHDGQPFLCLELVQGLDLARLTRWARRARRVVGVDVALYVMRALLAGLDAAHAARDEKGRPLEIVHGDVSPANVLLSLDGDVKLADFGVARSRLRALFPQVAAAGRTKGRLGYLAPEQVRGEPTDARADVFAATVVGTELVIGEPLFGRESELETLLAIRDGVVSPLLAHARSLPAGLVDVLLQGLAREPDARFATAAALREALAPFDPEPSAPARAALAGLVAQAVGRADGEPSEHDMDTRRPPPLEAPLAGSKERYVVETRDAVLGHLSFAQLVEALLRGTVGPDDVVRNSDASAWRVRDVPGIADHLAALPGGSSDARDLRGGGIVEALARSAAARAEGVWQCRCGAVHKDVYLIDGVPEFVQSNVASELLGELLVARGVVSRGELEMALAVLPRFDGRLGDTLSALGLVQPVEIFRHISDQVHEKLIEIFTWTEGRATFHDGASPPKRYFPLGLDPWRVLRTGIERRRAMGLDADRIARARSTPLRPTGVPLPEGVPADLERALSERSRPFTLDELERAFRGDEALAWGVARIGLALGVVREG